MSFYLLEATSLVRRILSVRFIRTYAMSSVSIKSRTLSNLLQPAWKCLPFNAFRRTSAPRTLLHRTPPNPPSYQLLQDHCFSTNVEPSKKIPSEVSIVEVGPRDGLQNEKKVVSTNDKVTLIEMLLNAGCCRMEVGALVNPKLVPNMANSMEVMQRLYPMKTDRVQFSCLIPKMNSLETIRNTTPVDHIAIFASATETFSHKVRVSWQSVLRVWSLD